MGMIEDFRKLNFALLCETNPKQAAKEFIEMSNEVANVHELCLCEHRHIIPKPNELYRFTVDMNCDSCKAIAATYEAKEVKYGA